MTSIGMGSQHSDDLTTAASIGHRNHTWYVAYMAALFEADNQRIAERIREAQTLMIAREREILGQSMSCPERAALSKAFHAMDALQFCVKMNDKHD